MGATVSTVDAESTRFEESSKEARHRTARGQDDVVNAFRLGVHEKEAVDLECVLIVEELPARGRVRDLRRDGARLHFRDEARRAAAHHVVGAHLNLDGLAVDVKRVAARDLRAFDRIAAVLEDARRFALADRGPMKAMTQRRATKEAAKPAPDEDDDRGSRDRDEPFARNVVEHGS